MRTVVNLLWSNQELEAIKLTLYLFVVIDFKVVVNNGLVECELFSITLILSLFSLAGKFKSLQSLVPIFIWLEFISSFFTKKSVSLWFILNSAKIMVLNLELSSLLLEKYFELFNTVSHFNSIILIKF